MLAHAERNGYAVGYFESWNLESLLAVADAAEETRSPVFLGFSGIYLPHHSRIAKDRLSYYAKLGLEVYEKLTVPACLVFNESADLAWVLEAASLGFGMTMFTDERLSPSELARIVRRVADTAHKAGAATEGEIDTLPGVGGELTALPERIRVSDPERALRFVEETGVDALAVNIGQAHLHGRGTAPLGFELLAELKRTVSVPLVLHGASSVAEQDIREAIRCGISKINVGSVLKRTFFEAMKTACAGISGSYNPYEVIGSGFSTDVLASGRKAMQTTVEHLMRLFGSAGKA